MKKEMATSILVGAAKILVGSSLMKEIFELVSAYMNVEGLTGPEKKERVKKELRDVYGEGSKVLQGIAGFLLDTTIGIAHAYIQVRLK